MDINFLKSLLDSIGSSNSPSQQYSDSPMDPMQNQKSLLSPMMSPPGIQDSLYNYTESPESNMLQGKALSMPVPTSAETMNQFSQPSYDTSIPAPMTVPAMTKSPLIKSMPQAPTPDMMAAMAPQPPMPEALPQEPQGPSMEDIMGKLQAERQSQLRNINLIESADRIGQAMAGQGNLKYEGGRFDGLKNIAQMDLSDFLEKDKFKKDNTKFDLDTTKSKLDIEKARGEAGDVAAQRDPKSELSKVSRASVIDSLNRIGRKDLASKVNETMSSKQIEDLFGQNNLANMVSQFEANENRKTIANTRAEEKKDIRDNKKTEKLEKFTSDFRKELTGSGAIGKAYGNYLNADRSVNAINQYLKNPTGYTDYSSIMSSLKALQGDDSVVREAEMRMGVQATSLPNKIKNWTDSMATGKSLQPEQRKQMARAVEILKSVASDQFKRTASPVLKQADRLGIDKTEILGADFVDTEETSMPITPEIKNKAMEELKRRQGK